MVDVVTMGSEDTLAKATKIMNAGNLNARAHPVREFHHKLIKQEIETMEKLGIPEENVNVTRLHENPIQKISENDVIYMGGGNQYRYLMRFLDTGLFPQIRDYVEQDRLYVGARALN